jgi:hypothetical protein
MRRFLAGKVSIVEDGRMDGYYEEVEKYRNKRNYVPLVPLNGTTSPSYPPRTGHIASLGRTRTGTCPAGSSPEGRFSSGVHRCRLSHEKPEIVLVILRHIYNNEGHTDSRGKADRAGMRMYRKKQRPHRSQYRDGARRSNREGR